MAFRIIGNFVGATSDETDPGAERRDRGVQGEQQHFERLR
jgi:hypothetical protein